MYLPLKLYTTPESLIIFQLSIPLWFSRRWGWKIEGKKYRDRLFAPQITIGEGKNVKCLHLYILGLRLRIRSFKLMKELQPGTRQILFTQYVGWQQVF